MNFTHEIVRLRDVLQALTAQLLAQDVMLTAMAVVVARELDFRGVLNELEAHAMDLVAEVPLAGDEAEADAIRAAAHCLLADRLASLRRNFVGRACSPWEGTA